MKNKQRDLKIVDFLRKRKNYRILMNSANNASLQINNGQKVFGGHVSGAIMTLHRAIILKFKNGVSESEFLNIIKILKNDHISNSKKGIIE